LAGWLAVKRHVAGWLTVRLAGWLAGCLASWLAGWLAGWLAAWKATPLDKHLIDQKKIQN
jgi:fructose-specific phosphotransferase system IIC component